ncbi:MAG: S8 family serine peptidase [Aquabacterium sp.]|uniref:S8 family serine peptidase n=1 Tax=Aquabacterium sp. TaxID=1872578 RepID=UPI0025C41F70|nr:S8 family serine peptidase [Aquabacterium sp.]MBI3380469.1 S8 family serine peptidase [Aquabacterium sp.]
MPTYFGLRPCARAAALTLTLILSACGGGGGGQPEARTSDKDGGSDVVTMSGTLSLVETAAVDSDTNDPNQASRHNNDDFDVAQALTTPVNLVGTVNEPGSGPDGPNKTAGDQYDVFVVDLQANQTVELQFAADPGVNDLDLAILDDSPKVVGLSAGTGNTECVRIAKAGRYYIAVYAHGGASIYNLRVGSPDSVSSCPNATSAEGAIVAGQVIAQPLDSNVVANRSSSVASTSGSPKQAQGVKSMLEFHREAGLSQLSVPRGAPNLLTLPDTAQARLKGLSQLASYTSFKRASALAQQASRPAQRSESLAQALDTVSYAKALMATGQYKFVSLNHRVQLSQMVADVGNFPPNDPIYPKQRWHYEQINLPAAMDRLVNLPTQPTRRPLVAVIDSGIMVDHPDLAPQIEGGRTFVSLNTRNAGEADSSNPDDLDLPTAAGDPHFHGSHVAGTIAARTFDGYGAAGIAPMARLMPLRVFDQRRPTGADDYDILNAMLYAAGLPNRSKLFPPRKADVINMSLGSSQACPPSYVDIIQQVRQAGVIVVVAAGNDARNNDGVAVPVAAPANCPGVVAVGALDAQARQANYSQSGPELRVAAPGGDMSRSTTGEPQGDMVDSTVAIFSPEGKRQPGFAYMQGTSMATPHVAGVVALMKYAYPGLTPELFDAWLSAGKLTDDIGGPGFDSATGYGLINARKAVDVALAEAQNPGPAPQGRIVATPFALDFGAQRTSMSLALNATAKTSDVVKQITSSSPALTFTRTSVDVQTGLGSYTINVDRTRLPTGTAFLSLNIQTNSDTLTVQVTVVKQAGGSTGARSADYGAVYVLAIDSITEEVIDEVLVTAQGGRYNWQLKGPRGKKAYLLAGGDLDWNGFICDAGEPCGVYPLMSNAPTEVTLDSNLSNLNFSLAPMGTGGATQAALAGTKPAAWTPRLRLPAR